jgi:hypothetical protein
MLLLAAGYRFMQLPPERWARGSGTCASGLDGSCGTVPLASTTPPVPVARRSFPPAVQEYAATRPIRFYWTPTNASWLNRIESHFTALRKFALTNTDYPTHEEQQEAMESYLRWRNGERPLEILDGEMYCWEAKETG